MKCRTATIFSVLILTGLLVPFAFATRIANVEPTPYTTYHKGDSYTTFYSPSEIAPPNESKSPIITITSPVNSTLIFSNNLTLTFNLTLEGPHAIALESVVCKPSWQSENIPVNSISSSKFVNKTLSFSISLTDITEGPQTITVLVNTLCEFETGREEKTFSTGSGIVEQKYLYVYSNYYFLEGFSSVNFTIDTSPTVIPSPTSGNSSGSNYNIGIFGLGITVLVVFAIALVGLVYLKKYHKRKLTSKQSLL